ncbi:MAG: molybdenum cofactor guanylyltransferase [Bacteroidales bacterium]|nr:molybdenum cofactor guanylyltransferase [Bacteroidales bacterium]
MTGILLAGGQSKRMGTDKAFLLYRHKQLFEYPLDILKAFCDEILISSSDPRFMATGYPVIPDAFPGKGPMAGLFTCLSRAKSSGSLVLSCDLPLMDPAFIYFLIDRSMKFPITIGTNRQGKPEPMAGIYEKEILPAMESLLIDGKNKLQGLLAKTRVQYIHPEKEGFDPDQIYLNINKPEDLTKLQNIPKGNGEIR